MIAAAIGKRVPPEWWDDPFFKALDSLQEIGWTQEGIAQTVDYSLATVFRWIHRKMLPNLPGLRSIERLAEREKVSLVTNRQRQ